MMYGKRTKFPFTVTTEQEKHKTHMGKFLIYPPKNKKGKLKQMQI